MQSRPAVSSAATASPLLFPAAFRAAFAALPDPRRAQGRRFPLAALLTLAVVALLSNHLSVLAIAQFGKRQSPAILAALGFPAGRAPHQSTLQRLFRKLDPLPLAVALTACFAPASSPDAPRGSVGVALDGKAHRGRLAYADYPGYPVHMLSAVLHEQGIVLAQLPLDHAGTKAAAELTAAPTLIARLDWHGCVLTGDALYADTDVCDAVHDAGGDYLVIVKGNQPTILHATAALFAARADATIRAASLPPWDMRQATTLDKGHGRVEVRRLIASAELNDYLEWPDLAQVMRIERVWWAREKRHTAVRYALTSLPPAVADAERLLALVRGHWEIENGVHYVKDVALGEDRSTIRKGHGPSVMAILRDTVVNVLHRAGWRTIAERLRYYSGNLHAALTLLGIPLIQNA
jgi:predicted transposase YbfD/YdcC